MIDDQLLPVIFIGLMGLAVIVYAILDGYDLGVGILLPFDNEAKRDTMIASIGPFWDANETWLVLAIGIMLIAFPAAHSIVLYHLYLPAALMLIGLILRGVAFDFRAKAAVAHKMAWDRTFFAGSLITSLTQGYMLGMYVMGFDTSWQSHLFAVVSGLGVTAAYSLIGACWLIMKTEGRLQERSVRWARQANRATFAGVIAVSIINPIVNPGVFDRWFDFPLAMFVLLIPTLTLGLFYYNDRLLRKMPREDDKGCWKPFANVVLIFLMSFIGLAFRFFPVCVPGKMDIW